MFKPWSPSDRKSYTSLFQRVLWLLHWQSTGLGCPSPSTPDLEKREEQKSTVSGGWAGLLLLVAFGHRCLLLSAMPSPPQGSLKEVRVGNTGMEAQLANTKGARSSSGACQEGDDGGTPHQMECLPALKTLWRNRQQL